MAHVVSGTFQAAPSLVTLQRECEHGQRRSPAGPRPPSPTLRHLAAAGGTTWATVSTQPPFEAARCAPCSLR